MCKTVTHSVRVCMCVCVGGCLDVSVTGAKQVRAHKSEETALRVKKAGTERVPAQTNTEADSPSVLARL